ncbi:MAG: YIP1 family protein [Candidatus Saganbacteria bacterium]|nr:YIP1 family protein [Candidatus Saganbacteria bacterium]
MNIFDRARDIIIHPKEEWQTIKAEKTDIKALFVNYAAPLALIPSVAGLIGITLVGISLPVGGIVRAPLLQSLLGAVIGYVLNLAALFAVGWLVKVLAPVFKARADLAGSMKVVAYSMTPAWLVGIFSLVPGLGVLSILGLYGLYLLYLGLKEVLDTPAERVLLYTLAVIGLAIVVSFVFSIIMINFIYGPMYLRMMAY